MLTKTPDWTEQSRQPPQDAVPAALPGRWWVAHTRPRQEKALAGDLLASGIPCYLPLSKRVTIHRQTGRRSESLNPVFTGYLFFNATDNQRLRALATNRIVNLLDVPCERDLVADLRQIQHVLASGQPIEPEPAIQVGQWARVVAGPLAGLVGRVTERLSRLRLILSVRLLSQAVSVEVAAELLEPADPPPDATQDR